MTSLAMCKGDFRGRCRKGSDAQGSGVSLHPTKGELEGGLFLLSNAREKKTFQTSARIEPARSDIQKTINLFIELLGKQYE